MQLERESALLSRLDQNAVEIVGGMSVDQKEEILVSFARGEIERLITKAKMTSMGLNWQHCNHTVFFQPGAMSSITRPYADFGALGKSERSSATW